MTQEGEKEIVLGNKQLISLFFVVVALLGVFFAAGYMIGRKSVTPVSAADASTAPPQTTVSSQPRQESEPPRETASRPDPGPGTETPAQPAASELKTEKPEPVTEVTARKPDTPRPATVGDAVVSKPEFGATYLQVTALRRPDADNLVRSLREQSFPVILTESPKEGLYRVLVGPYHETAKVAESKNRLKALGFANAFVQK